MSTILKAINDFVDALVKFDMGGLATGVGSWRRLVSVW